MREIGEEPGDGMDTSALLARELRRRLEAARRRAAFVRRWEQEHPERRCAVVGEGTPEAPFIIIGGEHGKP